MDLGVGTGLSLNLYPVQCHVTGIDLSEAMLDVARRRVKIWGLNNVELACMGAEEIVDRFPAHHFDFIFAAFVISVVDDPVDVLKKMVRLGRPDATFVLVNHFRSANPLLGTAERLLDPLCQKIGWKNGVDLDGIIEAAGLEVVSRSKYLPTDIWTIVTARKARPVPS
jgi:phosphatidylethanolamine/phosphatidyl-N-methylethanolamine N-methyltransferase